MVLHSIATTKNKWTKKMAGCRLNALTLAVDLSVLDFFDQGGDSFVQKGVAQGIESQRIQLSLLDSLIALD
jgi:hypothetical protein